MGFILSRPPSSLNVSPFFSALSTFMVGSVFVVVGFPFEGTWQPVPPPRKRSTFVSLRPPQDFFVAPILSLVPSSLFLLPMNLAPFHVFSPTVWVSSVLCFWSSLCFFFSATPPRFLAVRISVRSIFSLSEEADVEDRSDFCSTSPPKRTSPFHHFLDPFTQPSSLQLRTFTP